MPRSKSSPNLRRLCLTAVAKNMNYFCEDFVKNFKDEKLLYVIGPFDCLPYSLVNELFTVMKELKLIRKCHLMLLIHPGTEKIDLSRTCSNEIQIPFALNLIGRVCKNLKHLDLSFCDKIHPQIFVEMSRSISTIVSLDLRSTGCTDSVLAAIGRHCPELRTLDVSWCPVTDDGIGALCINMDDIESSNSRSLKITRLALIGTNVTDRGSMIAIKYLPFLRNFECQNNCRSLLLLYGDSDWSGINELETLYYDCDSNTSVSRTSIEMACVTCPNVSKICFTNTNTSDEVLMLLSNFEKLNEFAFGNGPMSSVTFNGIGSLLRLRGTILTTLELVQVDQVDVNAIGQCCPCLKHLELLFIPGYDRSNKWTDRSVERPFEFLKVLRVVCTEDDDIPSKQMLILLSHCCNIESIFLQRCQTLTDSLLSQVFNSNTMPKLMDIELEYCNTLTVASIMTLFSLDNPLNSLKMWCCRGITRVDYSFLQDLVVQENFDTNVEWSGIPTWTRDENEELN